MLLSDHRVRIAAMVALGGWCVLAVFSIGFLLLPALVAEVVAVMKES